MRVCACVKRKAKPRKGHKVKPRAPSLSGSGIFSITVTYPLIDDKLY